MPRRRQTGRKRKRVSRPRRAMRPVVREEMKTLDVALTAATAMQFSADGITDDGAVPPTTPTTMILLNTIPTGTSATTRIGKRVVMKALQIRGHLLPNTASIYDVVSIILVYVRSNNQLTTLPAWNDIFTSQHPKSLTNRDNASKFKILRRWNYTMTGNSSAATSVTDLSTRFFDEYIVFKKPLVAQWTSASTFGRIGEFEKGSLLLLTNGTQLTASTTLYNKFYFQSRLYFTEADGYMF